MKNIYVIGNWKSNKTVSEAVEWMNGISESSHILKASTSQSLKSGNTLEVIVCGPFTALSEMKRIRDEFHLPISIGAQDVSPFPEGAYTGEVSARMVKELADWVIIGHSERRSYEEESDEELSFETQMAKDAELKTIYCVSEPHMHIPQFADIVGYEPLSAIGSGKSQSPDEAASVIHTIKTVSRVPTAVYGGSVKPDNVKGYLSREEIDGVLVGGASLNPETFLELINAVSSYVT